MTYNNYNGGYNNYNDGYNNYTDRYNNYNDGGYYGLVVVPPPRPCPPPRPQTLHRSHDNLKNPYRIAAIFYM